MNIVATAFAGYDCLLITNRSLSVWITISAGPRIIGLSLNGGNNLLAIVPDATTTTPSGRLYHFRGGHRLWHAPEHPERSYGPEDKPVEATKLDRGLHLRQTSEIRANGIEKEMAVTLPDNNSHVVIDHRLTNHNQWPVTLAPWAITQLAPGGIAALPLFAPSTGLLPNRRLAIWPYTDTSSPHLRWGELFLFVQAKLVGDEKLKVGWANAAGWLAYWLDDTLFVKEAPYQPAATYPDFGSSSECYADARFLELETLGPLVTLEPGEHTEHRELWRLHRPAPQPYPKDEQALIAFLEQP